MVEKFGNARFGILYSVSVSMNLRKMAFQTPILFNYSSTLQLFNPSTFQLMFKNPFLLFLGTAIVLRIFFFFSYRDQPR